MGQENTSPRKINGVEGVLGQVMKSGGPGAVETWGFEDYGLSFEGTVTGIAGAPQFQCAGLAGFGNDYFEDYYAYVVWDAGGAGGAPQGEYLQIAGYTSVGGNFNLGAFTVAIAVGDKVLIMHPTLAQIMMAYDIVSDVGVGNAALQALLAAITPAGPTNAQMNTAIALCAQIADGWDAALATILDNFTAARIGYLDELDFDLQGTLSTIAGYIDAEIAAIITSQGRQLFTMDFWSLPQEEVALTVAAGDKALPSVTVADLPAGATIVRAIAMFKFRMVENHTYAGENKLDGAQEIQVAASVDAINFVDTQFTLAETTREGGDVVIGVIDIAGTVNANGAYAFHWDLAKALQTGINFNDVQVGLRIWYSV